MTRRVSGLSMTGRVSSAVRLKRSSAMRRSSPGRRNGAGVATRSCTVLSPLALAGSLTLAGSMRPQRRPSSSTTNTCLMLPGGNRRRSSSSDKPAAIPAGAPRSIVRAPDRQTAQMEAPGRKGIAEPMPHHDRGGDDPNHDTDGRREVAGRLEDYHDHSHRRPDDRRGNGAHADQSIDQGIDPEIGSQPHHRRAGQAAEQTAEEEGGTE